MATRLGYGGGRQTFNKAESTPPLVAHGTSQTGSRLIAADKLSVPVAEDEACKSREERGVNKARA